jgi:hypothetical protein
MKCYIKLAILFLLLLSITVRSNGISENSPTIYDAHSDALDGLKDQKTESVSNNTTAQKIAIEHDLASKMIQLTWGILGFALLLVVFIGVISLKKPTGWDRELTRILTVILVIIAGLVLITAGYTDQQVAPMFGLLGTLVGYILGRSTSSSSDELLKPGQ